jgi:hypothetical protein
MPDIEDQIQKARDAGEFDHLPGKGKPFTHLGSDILKHLLSAQGFVPDWLARDREIQQKIEVAEQAIRRTYEWVLQAWSAGSVDRHFAQEEWQNAERVFDKRLAEINSLIKTYNLELPEAVRHLQKFPLQKDEALKRLGLIVKFK